jgi:short-subunit dehydrogenase
VDIANEEQVTEMVKETISAFQSIDVLVNNAGIGFFKTVDETSLDE